MFAIVAFKRELTHRSNPALNTHEVNWETRSYGCFNGFNTPGTAFTKMQGANGAATEDLACILVPRRTGAQSDTERMKEYRTQTGSFDAYADINNPRRMSERYMFAMRKAEHRVEYNRKMQDYTTGPWECLGMGWLANVIGSAGGAPSYLPPGYSQPGKIMNDPTIGNALQHEGFIRDYYDGNSGEMRRTRRVLTPNETFLSELCAPYQKASGLLYVSAELCQHSCLAACFANNRNHNGSLYQMVGSERSSGSAVAYLQMFRNTAENQNYGWTGALAGVASALQRTILPALSMSESRVAILDFFTHHGDDSSIVSFASNQFAAHVTRYGYFESAFMFRDPRSMIIESRYNKGGQSAHIHTRCAALIGGKSTSEIRAANYDYRELDQFKINARQHHDLANLVTPQQLNNVHQQGRRRTPEEATNYVFDRMRNIMMTYFGFNPGEAINNWVAAMRTFPDLRAPTVPDSAVNGSSSGFREWISTAQTAATVH